MTISIPGPEMAHPVYPHLEKRKNAAGATPDAGSVRETASLAALVTQLRQDLLRNTGA